MLWSYVTLQYINTAFMLQHLQYEQNTEPKKKAHQSGPGLAFMIMNFHW